MLLPLVISVFVHAPTVQWRAPPECPDAAAFEARVGALLGVVAGDGARAVVTVEPDPEGGFVAQVRCSAGGDETIREVRGPMCESVADAAALVLAVQIDALAVEAATAREPPSLPPPPPREPDRVATGVAAPDPVPTIVCCQDSFLTIVKHRVGADPPGELEKPSHASETSARKSP